MKLFGNPLELVILDVDGVILDLMACFQKNLEAAASQADLPIAPIKDYFTAVAAGMRHHHAGFTQAVRDWWPGLDDGAVRRVEQYFRAEERRNPYPPVAGATEAIVWLRARLIPVALCTTNNQETLTHRLKAAGINPGWFATASTWESIHPKPDPRALDPIFGSMTVPRSHSVYVGDWYPDLEVARGAGVRFIAVLSGGIPRHAFIREGVPGDHIIERLADLPKLITE